ncbi:MAG: hypothetical protein M0R70_07070 [Nitrospirae bacterium]|nr:hypothetical protein [Nitrospirota bacterium]
MMKHYILATLVSLLILSAMIFTPAASNAGLPLPPLPPLIIPAPPPVFLIPGTYTYFAPEVEVDLFFYGGYWYRPHGGGWYSSSHYGGPWGFIESNRVPGVLINLPSGYRNVPPGHERIPYGQLKKNWKTWEHNKHWDKQEKPKKSKAFVKQKSGDGGSFGGKSGKGKSKEKGKGKGK